MGGWVPYRVVLRDPPMAEVVGEGLTRATPNRGPKDRFAMPDGASPDRNQGSFGECNLAQRSCPQDLEAGAGLEATHLLRGAVRQDDPGARDHAPTGGGGLRRAAPAAGRVTGKLVVPASRAVPVTRSTLALRTALAPTDGGEGEVNRPLPRPP